MISLDQTLLSTYMLTLTVSVRSNKIALWNIKFLKMQFSSVMLPSSATSRKFIETVDL